PATPGGGAKSLRLVQAAAPASVDALAKAVATTDAKPAGPALHASDSDDDAFAVALGNAGQDDSDSSSDGSDSASSGPGAAAFQLGAPAAATPAAVNVPPAAAALAQANGPEITAQLAAQIAARASPVRSAFDFSLDPAGLGRVDVSLKIDPQGKLSAVL